MSAIRPNLPSFPAPLQPVQAPVRAARSDFFKAALDAVQAAGNEAPTRPAPAAQSAVAIQEERPTRPGALLDIRV